MHSYDEYQKAKARTSAAVNWIELRKSQDSQSGNLFSLSTAHSKLMLMRCGRHSAGGTNYWESPESFNSALLDVIKADFDFLADRVLKVLQKQEVAALIACESELAELSASIAAATAPVKPTDSSRG